MSGVPIFPPLIALVLFATWALVLVLAIGIWRLAAVLGGRTKINAFPSGVPHGGATYWRLHRAHVNTTENLPIFAALVLAGLYLQVQELAFQILPTLVLYARVAQSLIHVASNSVLAVSLRFVAYVVQAASMFVIAYCVLGATGGIAP
jgi:hypothetical protein